MFSEEFRVSLAPVGSEGDSAVKWTRGDSSRVGGRRSGNVATEPVSGFRLYLTSVSQQLVRRLIASHSDHKRRDCGHEPSDSRIRGERRLGSEEFVDPGEKTVGGRRGSGRSLSPTLRSPGCVRGGT